MCKAIDKNSVCCLHLSKKVGLLVASFRILGRLFQIFFTWIIVGRVRQRCTLGSFQCRGVLLFWIIVGRTMLAVGAGGVVSTIISHYFSLSIPTEILSQRTVKSKSTTTT